MDWSVQSNMISYGHDIEGAWLVNEAAELVGDPDLLKESQQKTLKMVEAVMNEGMADDHSLLYEYDFDEGKMHTDRHWWVQGEAMVGFLDAYGHSGNEQFYKTFLKTWQYIKDHVIDHENGGWFGLIGDDGKPLPNGVKAGFWKCPYHNTRALIESIERIDKIPESQ
jgi:mannobiose 2-epimerase